MNNDLTSFQDQYKNLLTKEPFGKCLQELAKAIRTSDELFLLISEHNDMEENFRIGILDMDGRNKALSLLRYKYISFVNSIQENDLSQLGKLLDEIHDQILVVCPENRKAYMHQFFSSYYFKNITYHTIVENQPIEVDDYKIILFDPSFEDTATESKLLDYFLEETNAYIIYFLKFLDKEKKEIYSDRIYFANSIFSLYARIKEMLDFIKYYQGPA